LSGSDPE